MKRHTIFLLMLLLGVYAHAQQVVKGTVLDGSMPGEPLPGAVIRVPGTQTVTTSDADGRFSLTMPEGKVLVQVSMMSFKTQVINVKGKTNVVVTLVEDNKVLDEMVVVGYGSMAKRDLTGAMSQIKSEDIVRGGSVDVSHALQGKIAGVQVQQSDNSPGAGVSVTVRGANSFSTSSQPLYIVDGVPYNENPNATPASVADNNPQETNPLNFINPNDIEKIEVLKDASATAIYGSRGANGVIIITTKKGQTGKPKIELNASYGVSRLAKRIDVLDPLTYMQYQREAAQNTNYYEGGQREIRPDNGSWNGGVYKPGVLDYAPGFTTTDGLGNYWSSADNTADWQDEIYRTGSQQDYSLSVSGGSDKGWYSISGNYTRQCGIIRESGYQRYGLSLNLGRHITKWLELGSSSHVSQSVTDFQRTSSGDFGIVRSSLIFPVNYGANEVTTNDASLIWLAANPAAYIRGSKDQVRAINWFSSNYAEAKIRPWLKFRQNVGLGYNDAHRTSFYDSYTGEGKKPTPNGRMGKAANVWKSLTLESVFTVDKTWGQHRLNAVAGATFEKGAWDNSSVSVTNLPSFMTYKNNMALALDRPQTTSDAGQQTLESFLARVNYSLMGKYLFTASMRSDGSSKFVEGNKFATFFSGAVAWRASDEKFIQDLGVFSNLKFRLSFGQTGNQGIGSYRTLTVLESANYAFDKVLDRGVAQIDWRGEANPDLKWETTSQFNAGIDFGFLDNRLQLTVDYYYKKTFDLLQNVAQPYSSGYGQKLINSGNVTNEGLEFTLAYDIFRDGPFRWNINANLSLNRNKIGGLDGDQFATSLWSKYDEMFIQRNGCPMGALYGYVEDGYFDNVAEVLAMKQYSSYSYEEALRMVGEVKYRDLNGDGYIDKNDRTIIGDTNPDFVYGLTSNMSWKHWSLSFMMQGSQGNDLLNLNTADMKLSNVGNITVDAYRNRWTEDNKSGAKYPRATASDRNMELSNRYVENGSYLKLKYVTLAYEWEKPFKFMERLRLSFTATNVFTATKYSWMDPDVSAFGSDASRRGVDSYSYPSSRTFTLGLNATF